MVRTSTIAFTASLVVAPAFAAVAADWRMYQARSLVPEGGEASDLTAREYEDYATAYNRRDLADQVEDLSARNWATAGAKLAEHAIKHEKKHHKGHHAVHAAVDSSSSDNQRRELASDDYESLAARNWMTAGAKFAEHAIKHEKKHHKGHHAVHAAVDGSSSDNQRRELGDDYESLATRNWATAGAKFAEHAVKHEKKHHTGRHIVHAAVDVGSSYNQRRELASDDYEALAARQFDEPDSVLYERALLEDEDIYARDFYDEDYGLYARSVAGHFLEDLD